MRLAITLNDKLCVIAEKIADVFPELVLSPELRTQQLPISQQFP
jgi:hypothetical protein